MKYKIVLLYLNYNNQRILPANKTMLCVLLLLTVVGNTALGQLLEAITVPKTLKNVIPVVSALENATNIQLYCYINRTTDGEQRRTRWSLIRDETDPVFIKLNINGTPAQSFFNNFMAEGEGTFHTNLTILSFNSSFDNTAIGCGSAEFIVGRFYLRIIRK